MKLSHAATLVILALSPPLPAIAQEDKRNWWEFGLADPVLDEIALYYLGQTWQQSSDVAEVLETLSRLNNSDPWSWTTEWKKTAERLETLGKDTETAGHSLSAGQAYLRAATYYRASLHRHPDPFDPEVKAMAEKEVEVYKKFLALTKYPCESVAIPYENTTLPGYLCINPNVQGPAPTIMFNEGKDGWAEDGKFIVDAAMTRGYNVLLWDGPGMGKTIRIQGLVFRHDWENVVTPIIDYLVTIPKVDPKQIAMITLSLGGFLGPRAALFEKRLRGLVANPGVLNWYKVYTDVLNSMDPNLLSLLDADPAAFDEQILGMMQFSDFLDWGMRDSCWHHGADPNKPSELIFEIRKFNIEGMLGNFTTPILVVDAEAEERGQAMELYSALPETVDKTYTFFTSQEAAQFHDQPGATAIMSARIMDWLDDRFVESATLTSGSGVFSFHASFAFIGIVVGFILL